MTLPADAYLISFFPVRDLSASRDFYERDLGLGLIRDQGTCVILRAPHRGLLGLCQADDDARHGVADRVVLSFVTDDVDGVYRRMRSLGIETEGRPRHHPRFAIYHFFARDPDGYRVEVQRFAAALPGSGERSGEQGA